MLIERCVLDHALHRLSVSWTAEADQVVAETPAHALEKFLKHDPVESAEQQRPFALRQQVEGNPEIADLASCQINADRIKGLKLWMGQQFSHVMSPECSEPADAAENHIGGSLPRDHIDGDVNALKRP